MSVSRRDVRGPSRAEPEFRADTRLLTTAQWEDADIPTGRIRPGQNIVVEGKKVTVHGCKDWSNQTPIDLDGRRYVPAGKLCGGVDFAGRTVFVVRDSDGWRFAGDPSWSVKVPGERWAS